MSGMFHDHFSGFANRYADFRPHYPAALFDYLATLVPREARVWDCACGNGQATMDLAERFEHVLATDASRQQINSAPTHPRVEFQVAAADQSGLSDASVGLVTVAQALHWFALDHFYAEVRRVLKPGGILAVWAYGLTQAEGGAVNQLVQEFYGETVGPYWPPERRLVEEGYRTLAFPFLELTPPVFHMETHWTLSQLIGYFSTWSATNRFIQATGRNPLEPLTAALTRVWGDARAPRLITWPLSMRVGVCR
jgi:ubiquinone/menaquinone biosynthesis C-methylase UbiE